jgi:hypothetical protein
MKIEISPAVTVEQFESTVAMLEAFCEEHGTALIATRDGYTIIPQNHAAVVDFVAWQAGWTENAANLLPA